ncbi:hypothetical protein SRB5_20820 [Streptomyces sp. RB5]|uniref:Uncharacterized protein n=1 Tax=Streptomyces smaragdinus TaxID=2585196 RepID=A0A7K0CGS8_9ACTN|nr:hypothetical protein [Streptomyces smaragdinus]
MTLSTPQTSAAPARAVGLCFPGATPGPPAGGQGRTDTPD